MFTTPFLSALPIQFIENTIPYPDKYLPANQILQLLIYLVNTLTGLSIWMKSGSLLKVWNTGASMCESTKAYFVILWAQHVHQFHHLRESNSNVPNPVERLNEEIPHLSFYQFIRYRFFFTLPVFSKRSLIYS